MDKRSKVAVIGTSIMVIIIAIALTITIIERLSPSDEVMELTDYYTVGDNEVLVIMQDHIYDKKELLIDGEVYIDYETVVKEFNHRFYWDYNENILTYTTPDEILQAEAGSNSYSIIKSMIRTNGSGNYPIAKVFADKVYISIDFVSKYSDMTYKFYANPNRVVINYKWGDYLFTEVEKATQLRQDASIKSPILRELAVGTKLMYVGMEEAPKKGFTMVMTEDGIIGYVGNKHIKESYYETLASDYI